ncbi:MAG: flavin reductase family protein [Pseudomonadota bacterium]
MDDPTPGSDKSADNTAATSARTDVDPGRDLSEAADGDRTFDQKTFRQAVGQFATGVTVVTTLFEGSPKGLTVNSFTSVSLAPPLVLWNLGEGSDSHRAFMDSDAFALHILHAGQEALAKRFATRGADKFGETPWRSGPAGLPLLDDCLISLECQVEHRYPGGDHAIIVGRVGAIHHGETGSPLIFHGGSFLTP